MQSQIERNVFSRKGDKLKNRAAYFGVFTALALILSYVETLIPIQFGIPGIKLGLANLIIVIVLYKRNAKEALFALCCACDPVRFSVWESFLVSYTAWPEEF